METHHRRRKQETGKLVHLFLVSQKRSHFYFLVLSKILILQICGFNAGNECCERLAYYGIAKNLITYYTSELHESNVSAARHVMIWQGTCYITPLIGAVIADSYLGRYWTIASFSAIYFIVRVKTNHPLWKIAFLGDCIVNLVFLIREWLC